MSERTAEISKNSKPNIVARVVKSRPVRVVTAGAVLGSLSALADVRPGFADPPLPNPGGGLNTGGALGTVSGPLQGPDQGSGITEPPPPGGDINRGGPPGTVSGPQPGPDQGPGQTGPAPRPGEDRGPNLPPRPVDHTRTMVPPTPENHDKTPTSTPPVTETPFTPTTTATPIVTFTPTVVRTKTPKPTFTPTTTATAEVTFTPTKTRVPPTPPVTGEGDDVEELVKVNNDNGNDIGIYAMVAGATIAAGTAVAVARSRRRTEYSEIAKMARKKGR